MKQLVHKLDSESGSVESGLVLIPLLALFLATLQLIAIVNYRNIDLAISQNEASSKAVYQIIEPNDQVVDLKSGDIFTRLRLLVTHTEREIPQIFPGITNLLGGKNLRTSGAAVFEEPEECSGGYVVC